jgi:hypothetical protein
MEIISIGVVLVMAFLFLERPRFNKGVCRVCKNTGEILCVTGEHDYDVCSCIQK